MSDLMKGEGEGEGESGCSKHWFMTLERTAPALGPKPHQQLTHTIMQEHHVMSRNYSR